jgi:hypothetical protein
LYSPSADVSSSTAQRAYARDVTAVFQPRRAALEHTRARVRELHEKVQTFTGPFDLPGEPDAHILASLGQIAERETRG